MGRILSYAAAVVLLISTGLVLAGPTAPSSSSTPSPPSAYVSSMSLWEAYSRGYVTIRQVDLTFNNGGQPFTAPLGFEVRNAGPLPVNIDEFAVLLSPNPRETRNPSDTTQDGILTHHVIPAGSTVDYAYGDFVADGVLPGPAWWCAEAFEYVKAGIGITLGGEIVPFDLNGLLGTMQGGPGGTQDQLWNHLATTPTVVVGKTVNSAFWLQIPETAGQALVVELRATNDAIKNTQDNVPDADAPNARVWDIVPVGYTLDITSIHPSGYSVASLSDGSVRVSWNANLPAADVTGRNPSTTPTPYVSRAFGYRMTTPHLAVGRATLPRALVSANADFTGEANSAQPVMDVLRVELPPVPDAGGPYVANEGDAITVSAAASTDPNGDALTFRWDFTADGTWDTGWSSSPTASFTFPDDFVGPVRVDVSDGGMEATADAPVLVRNVAPAVSAGPDRTAAEGGSISFEFAFSDPGFDNPAMGTRETFTASVDWGYGPVEALAVETVPGSSGVPTTGTIAASHTYGDNGAFPVTVTVCDDDGGCGSGALNVAVGNIPPALSNVRVFAQGSMTLRIAGEKWHDVTLAIAQGGTLRSLSIVRMPGSPDRQQATMDDVEIELTSDISITLYYTPADDPVNGQPNGANPVWVIFTTADGGQVRLHHTFNVRHPGTWTWHLDAIAPMLVGRAIRLTAAASDPGSDDLTLSVDWRNGATSSAIVFSGGAGADPFPSPEVRPQAATFAFSATYLTAGTFTISVTLTDDDGGSAATTLILRLG